MSGRMRTWRRAPGSAKRPPNSRAGRPTPANSSSARRARCSSRRRSRQSSSRPAGGIYEIRTVHAEAGRGPEPDRPLVHGDRRARQAVAAGFRRAFRIGRPQHLVPHLGLQGRQPARRDPREGAQGRHLAAQGWAARHDAEAGKHAGRAGVVLAAALITDGTEMKRALRGAPFF